MMRLGIVREINDIRDKIFRKMEADKRDLVEADPERFWLYSEYRRTRRKLADDTERLIMDTPSGKPIIEEYNQMCIYYVAKKGEYAHEPYDEQEAWSCGMLPGL